MSQRLTSRTYTSRTYTLINHPVLTFVGLTLVIAALLLCSQNSSAQQAHTDPQSQTGSGFISADQSVQLEQVASGLGIPWGMVLLDNNRLLITERRGTIKLLDINSGSLTAVRGTPQVVAEGQGGLLDVAVDGDYQADSWLYFTYVTRPGWAGADSTGTTTLGRAKLQQQQLTDWQTLLVTQASTDTGQHFGSRIAFDDKHLYFGIGDRGVRDNGQDLSTHAGAILRLNKDGSVPADNPFTDKPDALPEIWSYGNRNPQGLVYDNSTQRLWEIEHGPRGGDELNLIKGGANYGWPVVSHGKEYWGPFDVGEATQKAGVVNPVKVYTPSIAPGSLLLYTGQAFPQWQGNLFAGALALRHLNRIIIDDNGNAIGEERLLKDLDARIRALAQSPEGWIYLSTDSGNIYRLRPQ